MRTAAVSFLLLVGLTLVGSGASGQIDGAPMSQWIFPDARSIGMGRAFTAVAEGPSAIWWNPGSLGLPHAVMVCPYSSTGLIGATHYAYAACGTLRDVGVGLHLSRIAYEPTDQTDELGNPIRRYTPSDWTALLGAGYDLARLRFSGRPPVHFGVGGNLKIAHLDRLPDQGRTAWNADLGILASTRFAFSGDRSDPTARAPDGGLHPYGGFRLGAVVKNVLAKRIRLAAGDRGVGMGQCLDAGAAAELGLFGVPELGQLIRIIGSAEVQKDLGAWNGRPIDSRGIEITLLNIVSWRTGYIDDRDGDIRGSTTGFGFGIELPGYLGLRYDHARSPTALPNLQFEHDSLSLTLQLDALLRGWGR